MKRVISSYFDWDDAGSEILPDSIYYWYKDTGAFPTYEEFMEDSGGNYSLADFEDALDTVITAVNKCQYYTENHVRYIYLLDSDIHRKVRFSTATKVKYPMMKLGEIYHDAIGSILSEFGDETGTALHLLGKDYNHIFCVDDTLDNVFRYKELKNLVKRLESDVIYELNHLDS